MITLNKSGQMSCHLEAYANGRFHHLGSTNPHKTMHVVKHAETASLLWLSNQKKINIFVKNKMQISFLLSISGVGRKKAELSLKNALRF